MYEPLLAGGPALLDTLTAYLEQGSSLEATRPDAVRPPEHGPVPAAPVTELTGFTLSDGRDGFTLWVAIILGRLAANHA